MSEDGAEHLKNQLTIARNEINKLRQQVRNLQHKQRKDIDDIARLLRNYCEGCRQLENNHNRNECITINKDAASNADTTTLTITTDVNSPPITKIEQQNPQAKDTFRPIGVIRTCFPEKRAVPRQSSVGGRLRGLIELNSDVFTNPEHALDGLEEYSHLWIIYHFHKNTSHPKAKVAPPRLGGERVGVFATRSPHRPCPIGLSLVEIERVEAACISFYGTDMVDGTPVLDIKPYIPFYDSPITMESGRISAGPCEPTSDFYNFRQEPDGEESEMEMMGAVSLAQTPVNFSNHYTPPPQAVKVPAWVTLTHRLNVTFNDRAESQLQSLGMQKQCIIDILEADPRSVYLRTKYNSQIFTFQLSEVTVTCKFDDKNSNVTVLQIRPTEHLQDVNNEQQQHCSTGESNHE
ncbi:tRNA (adenine(37)-N6)-methyltransferase [Stomoxys calcitrans]|uniref:TsaA-like domain-containing protein n=1 Tax=Stomoxys calcitrans TaxID=35570 RepID=A0A1I8Q1R9_STOCA|nr:tRNA (adenine(37)-N6)-methyltransferase [Stomoxys calcitrans]